MLVCGLDTLRAAGADSTEHVPQAVHSTVALDSRVNRIALLLSKEKSAYSKRVEGGDGRRKQRREKELERERERESERERVETSEEKTDIQEN